MVNIHFICRGNVLRSLIAETYLKSLKLQHVHVISSGTIVDWSNETERGYFTNTLALLDRHGIKSYAKAKPDQLTQERAANQDVTVYMNQVVFDEASAIVTLPDNAVSWNITDIGEGTRTDTTHRELYEEDIYNEITQKVDDLIKMIIKV